MKYSVRAKVILEHIVEAESEKEAIEKADQIGDMEANFIWNIYKNNQPWKAKLIGL